MGRKRKYFSTNLQTASLYILQSTIVEKKYFCCCCLGPQNGQICFFNLVKGKILVNLHAGVFLDMEQLGF